ncbi:hypothetical protein [Rhodohalobacter halophilus]|uniref:hypothetical protein n=1 Tax=Rhodohalobacter halophilus TaxID=1812810 RepID=UPI00083FAB95|nr:hypothetical protein [Rhodohalobacter halophilus]
MKNAIKFWGIVILLILLSRYVGGLLGEKAAIRNNFDVAKNLNLELPKVIDGISQDSVSFSTGDNSTLGTFTWYHTDLNTEGFTFDEFSREFYMEMARNYISSNVCNDDKIKELRSHHTLKYTYFSLDGNEIGSVEVHPSDCQ